MAGRWISISGALLLLSTPGLYQAGTYAGGMGLLPLPFPEGPSCCAPTVIDARFHRVSPLLFALVHFPVAVVFLCRRKDAASLALLFVFIPLQLDVLTTLVQDRDWEALPWISLLMPATIVGGMLWFQGELAGAGALARLSVGLLLAQAHALIWSAWGADPRVAGAWMGLLGGLLIAAGEVIASRRPASSASAWRPCPPLSRRTSWRRA
jgi:hypothetical protein